VQKRGVCFPPSAIRHHVSLYVDDMVVFVAPQAHDIRATREVLEIFASTSGLHTNVQKCQDTPIRCSQEQIDMVQHPFPCQLANFPCKYLGIPLSVHRPRKVDLRPLVDNAVDHMPNWKGKRMSRAGRTTLVKVTLSVVPIHVSLAIKVTPSILRTIDRL
jgi:hypothetical protein